MKLDKFSEPNVLGSCTLTLDGTTVLVWEGPTCLLDIQFFTRFHGQRLDYTEHRQQGHKQRIQTPQEAAVVWGRNRFCNCQ